MTVKQLTGAPSANETRNWKAINWHKARSEVKRLQMRIAKAVQEKRYGKTQALQWMLTHSYSGKVLAVKRVTGNSGAKTSGIDGVIWKTVKQKIQAVSELRHSGIKTQPLRRIYIPKKNGQKRPLGIPTMMDRAHQALHLLALEPIAETTADINSYGFRPKRRTADDFIITGTSKEFLDEKVKPVLNNFLATRGLSLSDEKTRITHIEEGFDFLGFNVRKYDGKLLIKPSKGNIKAVLEKIRNIIKRSMVINYTVHLIRSPQHLADGIVSAANQWRRINAGGI